MGGYRIERRKNLDQYQTYEYELNAPCRTTAILTQAARAKLITTPYSTKYMLSFIHPLMAHFLLFIEPMNAG